MGKMKNNKTLINLAIAAGVGFVLYRFVLRPMIAKKEAKKQIEIYDKFDLIATNEPQPEENEEFNEFENVT